MAHFEVLRFSRRSNTARNRGEQRAEAKRLIREVESTHESRLRSLSVLLLRAESVASSKIEHMEAAMDDFARELHGVKANPAAT